MSKTNALTKSCLTLLNASGYKAWRNNNGAVYDGKKGIYRKNSNLLKGVSDILGYRKKDGRFLAVEIKTGKDVLSADQRYFLEEVNASGGHGLVIKNIDELITWLEG